MEFLLDPNVAYVLVVLGFFLGMLAIVSPGTGFLEIGALFCLVLAGYATWNISFHWWAVIILVLSMIPFYFAVRNMRRRLMLALTVLGVVVGSVFLYPGPNGNLIGVNPIVAIITSLLTGGFLWLGLSKSIEAHHAIPRHDLSTLIGQVGEAKSDIHETGSVQVAGELWSARSASKIPAGSMVKVIKREGFVLLVEKIN